MKKVERPRTPSSTQSKLPPLVEDYPRPPATAPAYLQQNSDRILELQEENEVLKRELLAKIRGNTKFIAGGHFKGQGACRGGQPQQSWGSKKSEPCRNCANLHRALEKERERVDLERRLRIETQERLNEEIQTGQNIMEALMHAERQLEELAEKEATTQSTQEHQEQVELDLRRELSELLEVKDNSADKEALTLEVEQLRLDLSNEQQRSLKLTADLDRQIGQNKAALEEKEQRLGELVGERDSLLCQLEALKAQAQGLGNELRSHQASVNAELQEANLALLADLKKMESVMRQRENHAEAQLREAREEAEQRVSQVQEEARRNRTQEAQSSQRIEQQRDTLERSNHELQRKLDSTRKQADNAFALEEKMTEMRVQMRELEAGRDSENEQVDALKRELSAEQSKLKRCKAELEVFRVQQAANETHLESMVQLVVVAPSVNVKLGNELALRKCTLEMPAIEETVATVIENEIIPNFLKVFASKLPSDLNPAALPKTYTDQLVQDMQRNVSEHLRPVLAQAWAVKPGTPASKPGTPSTRRPSTFLSKPSTPNTARPYIPPSTPKTSTHTVT